MKGTLRMSRFLDLNEEPSVESVSNHIVETMSEAVRLVLAVAPPPVAASVWGSLGATFLSNAVLMLKDESREELIDVVVRSVREKMALMGNPPGGSA